MNLNVLFMFLSTLKNLLYLKSLNSVEKMYVYSIRGIALQWLESLLANNKQLLIQTRDIWICLILNMVFLNALFADETNICFVRLQSRYTL